MHRQLIADATRLMSTTPEDLFKEAKRFHTGVTHPHHAERALADCDQFIRTGEAPEYVVDYALDNLRRLLSRPKATKKEILKKEESIFAGVPEDDGA